MVLTFRYRLKHPGNLPVLARAVNQVWNYCGDVQEQARRWRKRWPSAFDLIQLTRASRELGLHSDTIAAVCLQFVRARAVQAPAALAQVLGLQAFHRLGALQRATSHQACRRGLIYLKRRYRLWLHRPIAGKILCGSFAEDRCGRWYLNLQCEVDETLPTGQGEVGIDLGLATLATLSNGTKLDRQRITTQHQQQLATAQRAGRQARVKALHAKITNVRKDFLHRAAHAIASKYARIIVGNVNASSLARTRFAKSVLDAGWSMFRSFLRYKIEQLSLEKVAWVVRHGGSYEERDEYRSTQACSECGLVGGPKGVAGLRVREWVCAACGVAHDRDINAARNLLSGRNAGLRLTESPAL